MRKILLLTLLGSMCLPATLHATIDSVSVQNISFTPSSFTMNLGDTVRWIWAGGTHTTTSTSVPSGANSWSNSINSTNTTFTYVPNKAGTYNYFCQIHGNSMTATFTVVCNSAPQYNIAQLHASGVCVNSINNSNDTFTATSNFTGTTFTYSSSNATFLTLTNGMTAAIPNSSATSAAVKIVVTSSGGCKDSVTKTISIFTAPTPSFTYTHTGLNYSFFNTTSGTGNTYNWDFGDNNTSQTTGNATHTYVSRPTAYSACLTVTTPQGCMNKSCQSVPTGIAQINGPGYFTLSPNPAQNTLNLKFAYPLATTLTINDMTGKTLLKQNYNNASNATVDLSSLTPGYYTIRVTQQGMYHTEKLAIVK